MHYPSPGVERYDHNVSCAWRIIVARGKVISVTFSEFHLEPNRMCSYDWLQVRPIPILFTLGQSHSHSIYSRSIAVNPGLTHSIYYRSNPLPFQFLKVNPILIEFAPAQTPYSFLFLQIKAKAIPIPPGPSHSYSHSTRSKLFPFIFHQVKAISIPIPPDPSRFHSYSTRSKPFLLTSVLSQGRLYGVVS